MEEEGEMLSIREEWQSGSKPDPEYTPLRVSAITQTANPHVASDTPA